MILAQPEFTKLLAERNFIATQVTRNEVKDDVVILKINILYFIIRDVIGGREEKRKFGQGGSLRLTVCDQGQCLSWGPGGGGSPRIYTNHRNVKFDTWIVEIR